MSIQLTTNIAEVPGVAPRFVEAFRRLGIRSVADLVRHLPLRYEEEHAEEPIAAAAARVPPEAAVTLRGDVARCRWVPRGKRRVEATIEDGTGSVRITWFNAPWMKDKIHPGVCIRVWGRARKHAGTLQMVNPRWEAIEEGTELPPRRERLRPIYPASEELPSWRVEQAIDANLDDAVAVLDDHLHAEYRRLRELPMLAEAYRRIHRPEDLAEAADARRRLAFDELLLLQIGVMLKRRHRMETLKALALEHSSEVDDHIRGRLPFALTHWQDAAVAQIAADLTRTVPMNRLLQGDVGAGKTVVALYGMLMAVASRHQAALMAPTEILAEQHYASISEMLSNSRVRIELLTGAQPAAQRAAALAAMEAGEVDIVVGTHALLTGDVRFKSLALIVIDEQHRFGVHQRATMRSKGTDPAFVPHVLVMTATPIPRTLSLTIFGDLDVSTIRGLPPGRTPVHTSVMPQGRTGEVYAEVARRLAAGEQAYIVVPVIDESDLGLTDVRSRLSWLESGPLKGFRLAALHGRLDRDTREAVMPRFRRGEIMAVVATTVIEVGVDVPGASVMVIEHADRFGLAQLHQLRGRIGRSRKASTCILLADPKNPEAIARLEAIASTTDGFEIAERDLEIRGPGDLFGARQSGIAPFHAAELPRDLDLLRLARRDAEAWVAENPHLGGLRDALLRKRLLKAHGESLGLADVG